MAEENLMEFGDENKPPEVTSDSSLVEVPPGLVKSPVIVNSILKQSTKDNLIQLYTPVRKPDKGRLKVRFGSDSLLETPNVNPSRQTVAIKDCITEELECDGDQTSVGHVASQIVDNIVHTLPVFQSDPEITDCQTIENICDESAMDISIAETKVYKVSSSEHDVLDILSMADEVLRSFQPSSSFSLDDSCTLDLEAGLSHNTEPNQESAYVRENIKSEESAVEVGGEVVSNSETQANTSDESDSVGTEPIVTEKACTVYKTSEAKQFTPATDDVAADSKHDIDHSEAMDCEEAMDIDVDDEIVFHIKPNGLLENGEVLENAETKSANRSATEASDGVLENSEVLENVETKSADKSTTEDELSHIEEGDVGVTSKLNLNLNHVETEHAATIEQAGKADTANNQDAENPAPNPVRDDRRPSKGAKSADDSTDDEFMSADEEMEIGEIQGTPKSAATMSLQGADNMSPQGTPKPTGSEEQNVPSDSPGITPPKVAYSLNFDEMNLDAVNPFATKQSLMNSPDMCKNGESKEDKQSVAKPVASSEAPAKPENELNSLTEVKGATNNTAGDNKNGNALEDAPIKANTEKKDLTEDDTVQNEKNGSIDLEVQVANAQDGVKSTNVSEIVDDVTDNDKQDTLDVESISEPQEAAVSNQIQTNDVIGNESASDDMNNSATKAETTVDAQAGSQVSSITETVIAAGSPQIPVTKGSYNLDFLDMDGMDPFPTTKQIPNSPVASTKCEGGPINDDHFKPKQQILNSPVSAKPASPAEITNSDEPEKQEVDVDATSSLSTSQIGKEENTSKQNLNTNNSAVDEQTEQEPMPQIMNSPVVAEPTQCTHETVTSNVEEDIDAFKPKQQIFNSPPSKQAELIENKETTSSDIFENTSVGINNVNCDAVEESAEQTSKENLFGDLNPFESKNKVANSPAGNHGSDINLDKNNTDSVTSSKSPDCKNTLSMDNPFATNSKVANTPDGKTAENKPVAMTTNVSSSLAPAAGLDQNDPFEIKTTFLDNPMDNGEQTDEAADFFEVHSVTRRGDQTAQEGLAGLIDDAQFVPASLIFNDPAAFDMLEKFGNAPKQAESTLSRMSLYVKFDPLVDAPVPAPGTNRRISSVFSERRISMSVSQLEKVKEYGLDETLLLLGTPPKKKRQSLGLSRITTGHPRQEAVTDKSCKKIEPVLPTTSPSAVDQLLEYSPHRDNQQVKETPRMSMADLFTEEPADGNLFQELKYTEADMMKMKSEMKLVLEGMLINKDCEWSKKEKDWQKQMAQLRQKLAQSDENNKQIGHVFQKLEETTFKISDSKIEVEKKLKSVEDERDQALQDIQAVEASFSELHRRYEKAKNMLLAAKQNQDTLTNHVSTLQEKYKCTLEETVRELKTKSKEKVSQLCDELEKLKRHNDSSKDKFEAEKKLLHIKISNLETSIERKTEENKELTNICDSLLSKVE